MSYKHKDGHACIYEGERYAWQRDHYKLSQPQCRARSRVIRRRLLKRGIHLRVIKRWRLDNPFISSDIRAVLVNQTKLYKREAA
jgi:intein-encoded DNA endonuclease-like protein